MLYLMRHGRTDWNANRKLQGATDVPLNEEGREMARKAREMYKDIHIDVCYVSPLSRARETAAIFLEGRDVPVIVDERIREISFYEFEGFQNVLQRPEGFLYPFFRDPEHFDAQGRSESFEEIYARTGAFIKEVLMPDLVAGKDVLVVAHGGSNSAMMNQFRNVPLRDYWKKLPQNCEVVEITQSEIDVLAPFSAGNLQLKNRLVMPPMHMRFAKDGAVMPAHIEHYTKRAAHSGVGLIIVEHCYVHPSGKAADGQMSFAEDERIEGQKTLVDAMHEAGDVKVFCQLNHAGGMTSEEITGMESISASAAAHPVSGIIPRAMTKEEIAAMRQWYVDAAVRVKAAGYDGVEIHSAHSYMLNQFFSPITNHREDEYGPQTIENRTRLLKEILLGCRQALGDAYPIAVRLGGCDYTEGGTTPEDAAAACKILEENGADLIDLSGGMCFYSRKDRTEPGYFDEISAAVMKEVSLPVLLTGGVNTLDDAKGLLMTGRCDLVGVGRAILKDPCWLEHQ